MAELPNPNQHPPSGFRRRPSFLVPVLCAAAIIASVGAVLGFLVLPAEADSSPDQETLQGTEVAAPTAMSFTVATVTPPPAVELTATPRSLDLETGNNQSETTGAGPTATPRVLRIPEIDTVADVPATSDPEESPVAASDSRTTSPGDSSEPPPAFQTAMAKPPTAGATAVATTPPSTATSPPAPATATASATPTGPTATAAPPPAFQTAMAAPPTATPRPPTATPVATIATATAAPPTPRATSAGVQRTPTPSAEATATARPAPTRPAPVRATSMQPASGSTNPSLAPVHAR